MLQGLALQFDSCNWYAKDKILASVERNTAN